MVKNKSFFISFILIFLFQQSMSQELETINRHRRNRLADEYYEKGLRLFEKDQLLKAIENLETSASLDPKNYLTYFFLGSSYEKTGNLEKALLNYNVSLALKPDFSEGLFSRVIVYRRIGKCKQAIEDLNHLLELPEGETQVIYFRGIKFGENDIDTGFDQLLTMSTRESDIHRLLGQCYADLKQQELSIYHYTEAIRLSRGQDNLYVNRGLVYMESGKTDSARNDFQTALDINPQNALARYNYNLLEPQDMIESLDRINEIIQRNPRLPFAYANRAFYYFQHGDYDLAKIDYDSAINLDQKNHTNYLNRGMCYEKMNNMQEALKDYHEATSLNPSDPKVWYNLGNVYYKQEKFSNAIEAYTISIQLDPGNGTYYYNRGLSYFQKSDPNKACKDMKQALHLKMDLAGSFLNKNCPANKQ